MHSLNLHNSKQPQHKPYNCQFRLNSQIHTYYSIHLQKYLKCHCNSLRIQMLKRRHQIHLQFDYIFLYIFFYLNPNIIKYHKQFSHIEHIEPKIRYNHENIVVLSPRIKQFLRLLFFQQLPILSQSLEQISISLF